MPLCAQPMFRKHHQFKLNLEIAVLLEKINQRGQFDQDQSQPHENAISGVMFSTGSPALRSGST